MATQYPAKPLRRASSGSPAQRLRGHIAEDRDLFDMFEFQRAATLLGAEIALVGDHYPMPRCCGGPYNLANIRAAHSVCNGSTSGIRPQAIPVTVTAAQFEVSNQILALQAAQDR